MGKSYMLRKEHISGLGVPEIPYVTTKGNARLIRYEGNVQVAERFIQAVRYSQMKIGKTTLFCSFDPADILQQAAASSERYASGAPLSVLDGILIPVKDEVDCTRHLTNGGTTWLSKVRALRQDAVCVSRLRECGAILAGKTNMNELGMGVSGNNPHYGFASHTIRSCGTVGPKTTFGRITLEGVLPLNWTLEVVCPAAATVEDTLLVYAAILGPSAKDVLYSRPPTPHLPILEGAPGGGDFPSVIGSLKLGIYTDARKLTPVHQIIETGTSYSLSDVASQSPLWWFDDCSNEITAACKRALNALQEKYGGRNCDTRTCRTSNRSSDNCCSEVATASSADYEDGRKKDLCYEVRGTMAYFRSFTNREYIAAQSLRRRQMYHHEQVFREADIIVTPTTGITAPVINPGALSLGESNLKMTTNLMRYTAAANFIGLPAISVPVGHDPEGLPIGIHLMGRPWAEATLLQLASAIGAICAPLRKRPAMFYDLLTKDFSL